MLEVYSLSFFYYQDSSDVSELPSYFPIERQENALLKAERLKSPHLKEILKDLVLVSQNFCLPISNV